MTAPDLPAHASPGLPPIASPHPRKPPGPERFSLSRSSDKQDSQDTNALTKSFISPAQTPPSTPGTVSPPTVASKPKSFPVDTSHRPARNLLAELPTVECIVRTRIPTKFGQMWLHVYHNNIDNKEHLAIVFGDTIRSRSLFARKDGETEQDRLQRGAYEGVLHPSRTHSGLENANGSDGKMSPLLQSMHKAPAGKTLYGSTPAPERMARAWKAADSTSSSNESSGSSDGLTMKNGPSSISAPLVRVHSECYTGETVWSARCDCGEQLDEAARLMSEPSATGHGGVIIYLRQEGRGIGLSEKLKAYNLQDLGSDTVEANILLRHPADARSYGIATAMLMDLGLGRQVEGTGEKVRHDSNKIDDTWTSEGPGIRLLTNNPDKILAIEGPNREVIVRERVEMVPSAMGEEKAQYMRTKIEKMGHMLQMP